MQHQGNIVETLTIGSLYSQQETIVIQLNLLIHCIVSGTPTDEVETLNRRSLDTLLNHGLYEISA